MSPPRDFEELLAALDVRGARGSANLSLSMESGRLKRRILQLLLTGLVSIAGGAACMAYGWLAVGAVLIVAGISSWILAGRAVFQLERARLRNAWAELAQDTGLTIAELDQGMPGFTRRLDGALGGHRVAVYLARSRGGAVLECSLRDSDGVLHTKRPGGGLWPFTPEARALRAGRVKATLEALVAATRAG